MRGTRVWARLLGVQGTIVEDVSVEEDEDGEMAALVVAVRLRRGDQGRWRGSAGGDAPGRTVGRDAGAGATSTWGRPGASWRRTPPGFAARSTGWWWPGCPGRGMPPGTPAPSTTRWPGSRCEQAKSAVTELLRISWRVVGRIVTRVSADAQAKVDRFAGVRRIGIDEISYKRGHRYLTVVVDHDRNRLLWAAVGRDEKTLSMFFDELGETRCAAITLVSADAAAWIATVVRERCPNATLCLDPFHICQWASKALDGGPPRGVERGSAGRPDRGGPWAQRTPASHSARTPKT